MRRKAKNTSRRRGAPRKQQAGSHPQARQRARQPSATFAKGIPSAWQEHPEFQPAATPRQSSEALAAPRRRDVAWMLLVLALTAIWLMQNSLNNYIQQKYHQPSPLALFDESPAWQAGEQLRGVLQGGMDALTGFYAQKSEAWRDAFNDRYIEHKADTRLALVMDSRVSETGSPRTAEAPEPVRENPAPPPEATDKPRPQAKAAAPPEPAAQAGEYPVPPGLRLQQTDKVLFAGDSLMQGIAPFMRHTLRKEYRIDSVDLSKQSTGLAYPAFFDWPQTIEDAIANDPDLRLVVVMLGPNDAWDMPNPAKRSGPYLKFGSPEWEVVYRQRVARIISEAARHNVSVLWVGAPTVKNDKLNASVLKLMQVIESEVRQDGGTYLDTRELLGGVDDQFNDFVVVDGKKIIVRSADGIHFTPSGQRLLAQRALQQISIQTPPADDHS